MNSTDHLSELESLRSQVADLTRALAERDVSMRDLREQSNLLRTIIEGTAAETGDEFFASLVTQLTSTLHVQYAVISEVREGRLKKIHTVAVSAGGTLVGNFEYELSHTPCAAALTQTFACFDRDVQAAFPQFQRLADLGAESYCAVPLRTKGGTVIGLLVVMDTKPLRHGDDLQSLLRLLAPRVVVELERRRAELERVQALADLHNVMETVPDVMFTLDTQGNLVKWNRRLGDVTGYSPEELLNKPALAFVPLDEQTRTAAAIQRAFTEGYAELDGQMLTKDLRTIPYHWTGALLKNAQGEPIGITGVGRDVSEEKQAEEELTQQRRHLVDAQALAHLGSWGWDIDTGEVQWSDELFRIFGHEPGSIHVTYDTFLAALLPDDHDRVLAGINAALTGKMAYDIEYRIVRPNSEVRSIHARGDVYRDATGHPLSMAGTVLDITERKRIEDALRASEERWHLAVRGSNDGILDWNIQTGDVFFSSRWKAMRGFEDHEIRNDVDEWRSRIHPDDLDRVLQSIDAYLAKHTQEFCEEYRVQRKDGSCLWILARGVALWADDGTPLRMAGSETDITARKGAEEALVRSRDLLESFVEHTPVGVAMLDKSLRYVAVSRRWVEDYRLGDQQLIGKRHYDVFPEIKEMKGWQEIHQRCLSGAVERREEDRFIRADGSEDWLRWEVRPWHDITGEIGGIIMFTEVITARKQAEAALRASEERYRALYDETPTMYFTLATDGTVRSVNRFGAEQLGYQAEELIGHSVLRVFHEQDKETVVANLAECLATPETTRHWGFRKVRKDGSMIWVQETVRVDRSSTGETIVSVTCEDVTERKQAEQGLRFFRTLLDHVDDSIEIIDPQGGRFLDGNAKAASNLGYTRDELLALTVPDIDPLVTGPVFAGLVRGLRDAPARLVLDSIHRRKDGTTFPVEVSAQLIRLDKEYLVAIVRDITERKRVEEALRLAKFSMDRAADAVYWIDSQAKVLDANEAASLMLGYSKEELCAMTVHDLNPDFQADMWPEYWAEIQRRGTMVIETAYRAKNSRLIPVEVSVNHLAYEGKEYHCAFVRDITERMQAETTLRQSESRYRSLVDNAPIGIFLNEEGRFAYVNREMQRILHATSAEQLIGTQVLDRIAPEFHNVVKDRIRVLMDHQQSVPSLDEQYVRLDGSRVDVAVTAIPASVAGTPMMQVLVLDIGERKRMEYALRQREGDLRAAIEERERISQDLHDGILQSLFAVGLTLEASKSMMSPGNRKTAGPPLDQAIGQLNCVMREIRNFIAGLGSDLLKGKDLQSALQHMLDSLTQNQATRVRLAIEDRAAQAVSVEQSLHLLLVIQEAVSNCIRHGRAQEATVSLKMLKQGIRLSVRDNGRGFNPEAATGTGHGLANMAVRARKIGGRFTVMSKVNEGTRIVLDLPKEASDVLR